MKLPVVNCQHTGDQPQRPVKCAIGLPASSNRCAKCASRVPRSDGDAVVWAILPDPPPISRTTTARASAAQEWDPLHRFFLTWDGDRAAAIDYLTRMRTRLVMTTCPCLGGYDAFVAIDPPPVDRTADAMFAWTWRLHNAINTKLTKALMTLDEARARWA